MRAERTSGWVRWLALTFWLCKPIFLTIQVNNEVGVICMYKLFFSFRSLVIFSTREDIITKGFEMLIISGKGLLLVLSFCCCFLLFCFNVVGLSVFSSRTFCEWKSSYVVIMTAMSLHHWHVAKLKPLNSNVKPLNSNVNLNRKVSLVAILLGSASLWWLFVYLFLGFGWLFFESLMESRLVSNSLCKWSWPWTPALSRSRLQACTTTSGCTVDTRLGDPLVPPSLTWSLTGWPIAEMTGSDKHRVQSFQSKDHKCSLACSF